MASIIKASQRGAGPAAAFSLQDLSGSAGAPRAGSAHGAAPTEQEVAELCRRAEEQARAAAQSAAHEVLAEQVDRRLATLWPALEQAVQSIQEARTEWLAHWERTAIHVAAMMAARVIRRELERTPQITLDLVREALTLAAGSGDVKLRLHPDDFDTLGAHVQRLSTELSRLGQVDVVADPAIEKGGCRLDTRCGAIDQQFAAQLAQIERELN
ncbi:MAG: FliH/SctL family protein [Pirellulales bacterium]